MVEAIKVQRAAVIEKVINLITTEMTEEGKGELTGKFVIGILEEAIATIKSK